MDKTTTRNMMSERSNCIGRFSYVVLIVLAYHKAFHNLRHHILHQSQPAITIQRQNGLGMELHALNRQLTVANAHDHAVFGFSGYFKTSRERLFSSEQGVITANLEALRQALKDALILMDHERWLTVHGIIQHAQLAAKRLHDSLQAQADSKHRNASVRGILHQFRHAEVGRTLRARRNQDEMRRDFANELGRNSGAVSGHLGAGLPRIVSQRVDEAVVVIHQQ